MEGSPDGGNGTRSRAITELSYEEYQRFCLEYGGGADSLEMWLQLWRVLNERRDNGWHFETNSGNPFWAFGLAGEAHLTVVAQRDWLTVFTYLGDDVEPLTSIADIESWLPLAELANAGFSPTYKENRAFLESRGVDKAMLRDHDEQLRRQSRALDLKTES
jgi:hypothetical protein